VIEDGTYTATLDRIEEGLAVCLVEEGGAVVEEFVLDSEELPADCRSEGTVLEVTVEDDDLVGARADPERTRERKERLRERFDRLSRRPDEDPGDDEGS
jgi:hypothetical protein